MKILYYSSHPQLKLSVQSGPGTHMREMITALQNAGHEVLPLIMGEEINKAKKSGESAESLTGMKRILKKVIFASLWRTLKELLLIRYDKHVEKILDAKVLSFKPDLIYERGAYLQLSGIRIATKHKIRHFIEINSLYIEEMLQFEGSETYLKKRAIETERTQIALSSKVFVVTAVLKEYYKRYTDNPDKIIVTPNSIDPAKTQIDTDFKNQLIKKYKLGGKLVIGFVGSIFPYHGVDILIRAFSVLLKKRSDLVLFIVGDGYVIPGLKKLARSLSIDQNVIFTGKVPHKEVFTFIDMMRITVLPKTNSFCSPLKIFEYGAMGKAIVAANTSGVRDAMVHQKDGILTEPNEVALVNAIQILLDDPKMIEELGEHFRNKVLTRFTWKQTADRILTEYLS
jgi:glycosyltransferase involved in cell wall biosynthesis